MAQIQNHARNVLQNLEERRSQVARLRRTVDSLHATSTRTVGSYSPVSGHSSDPHSAVWDALADSREALKLRQQELRRDEENLEKWIDLLPRPRWRMVLRYRYLDNMSFKDVCTRMREDTGLDLSIHQIHGYHRRALEAAEVVWPVS